MFRLVHSICHTAMNTFPILLLNMKEKLFQEALSENMKNLPVKCNLHKILMQNIIL